MTRYHFPINEKEFETVVSFSPLDNIICQRKPFGDVTAEEYFEFAKSDLKSGDKSGLVNALSNAKRCFHYQIDRLLYRYALRKAFSKLDFPQKLEVLSELYIIPGTLLRVFNRERNAMEHNYTAPSREIVEGSIDLCDLLLLATERFIQNTPGRMRVKFRNDDRDIIILLELGADKIQFFEVLGTELEDGPNGKYYGGIISKFGADNELEEGITINRIANNDIKISLSNKDEWIHILRLFSAAARDPSGFLTLPNEPMAAIQHFLPWKKLKETIDKMSTEK